MSEISWLYSRHAQVRDMLRAMAAMLHIIMSGDRRVSFILWIAIGGSVKS